MRATAQSFALITDIHAAVFSPRSLIMPSRPRFFFSETDGLDLRFLRSRECHCILDGIRPALAQRKVVFAAAALIGVALHERSGTRVVAQIMRMSHHERPEFVL